MKSLEERRQFILEAGCCGGGDDLDNEAPMDAGEEGLEASLSPLQGFLKKRKAKRKKNG